jgi:hypothetical protein
MLERLVQLLESNQRDSEFKKIILYEKPRLHYGENRSKLVHFKEQKKTLCIFKTVYLCAILP